MTNEPNLKWYLYNAATNKPEGPMDASEVQNRLSARLIQPNSYIWAEGMADWAPINEVPELEPILRNFQPLPEKEFTGVLQSVNLATQPTTGNAQLNEVAPLTNEAPSNESKPEPDHPDYQDESNEAEEMKTKTTTTFTKATTKAAKTKKKTSIKKVLFFLSFGAVLGGAAYAFLNGYFDPIFSSPKVRSIVDELRPKIYTQIEKHSFLEPLKLFIKPVSLPDDVPEEEIETLLDAAGSSLQLKGPKVALALSNAPEHQSSPSFILAGNLPDGTSIDVRIVGVPETLLGHFENESQKTTRMEKRLARVSGFSGPKNAAFPKGDYLVEVQLSAEQPKEIQPVLAAFQNIDNRKPLYKGFMFLGGEKNAEYKQKLKEFHEKAVAQAMKEIADAKQFITSIETQKKQMNSEFDATRKIRPYSKAKARWKKFSENNSAFIKKMKDTTSEWTPELLSDGFFYGPVFSEIHLSIQLLESLQEKLNQAFSGNNPAPHSSFQEERVKIESEIDLHISKANDLISKIESQNKESGGFPRKMK